jgi:tetratricopeptide (TPR) repeat protein
MKTGSHRLLFAFLLMLVAWCRQPPAYGDEPKWLEIKAPHFSVVTDAGEKRGREVALRFEQMRSVFGQLMTRANVNLPVPLQIVAFRSTKEMREFAPIWQGKPTQLAGLFQPGEDRSFIMLDLSVADPWKVVFHEYAHQLMNGILSHQMDPWFEEGFAEYFSTIEVDDKEAHVGKPAPESVLVLEQNGMMKVTDLLQVRQYSQTYNESGDRRTGFYAESSILVHYIYDNNLMPKVATYFELKVYQKRPVEEAVQQAFGMSTAQLDKTLHDYLHNNRFRYMILKHPEHLGSSEYTALPMSAADSRAVLADIHLHSPDYRDKAVNEFLAILKTDPKNAAALRGLGYAYLQKGQFTEAGDYFRQAVQLDSKDPRVHYYSALLMSRNGGFSNQSNLPEMIKELETAISLDPNFADSYMLLGFAQGFSGDVASGLENIKKAVALSPRNEGYQFNLAQMYMRNRQPDQAMPLLQTLVLSQDQTLAARAAEFKRQAELMTQTSGQFAQQPTTEPVLTRKDNPAPPSQPATTTATENPSPAPPIPTEPPKNVTRTKFLQGTLMGVDCSTPPSAVLTVVSASVTWKLKVVDTGKAILFGADTFSCSWSKKKVAVNYRETGNSEGNVVSLELK